MEETELQNQNLIFLCKMCSSKLVPVDDSLPYFEKEWICPNVPERCNNRRKVTTVDLIDDRYNKECFDIITKQ